MAESERDESGQEDNYYVELCSNPTRFDPVSKVTNVFFDDTNKQVLSSSSDPL